MKKYLSNKLYLTVTAVFSLFSAVIAGTLILRGDDIIWKSGCSKSDIMGEQSLNGRYFTNLLTYLTTRYNIIGILTAFILLVMFHQLLLRVMDVGGTSFGYTALFSAFAVFTIDTATFSQTMNWLSGISCYVAATVLLLGYLLYCKPLFGSADPAYSRCSLVVPLITGFLGALCLENVTVYNVMLAVFVMIYSYKRFKKVYAGYILYFVAVVAGTVVMFTDHTYSSLFSQKSDADGFRSVKLDFSDISHQMYDNMFSFYSIKFWILHIIICVSFLVLYSAKFSDSPKKAPKYTLPALTVSVLYTSYSFFSVVFSSFAVWNVDLTIRAIEAAFTVIYVASLLYLGWALCGKDTALRFILYIVSTVVLSAPFVAVNPVNARCFFTDYVFWVLAACELTLEAGVAPKFEKNFVSRTFSAVVIGYLAFSLSYISIWNKYTDIKRISYIKEQVDSGKSTIEIITLPYPAYQAADTLAVYKSSLENNSDKSQLSNGEDLGYLIGKEILKENGIEFDPQEKNLVLITLYDYSLKD